MCNSSFQGNNLTSILDEMLKWYAMCQGHVGTLVVTTTTALFLFVGTPIHCWSLWVFLHGNIKPNLVFPLNITVLELLFSIHCIVDLIATKYLTVAYHQFSMFLIGLCWTVRPLLQICMCMEHYLAVIHPVTFLRYKGIQYRFALAAWLIGAASSVRLIFIRIEYFPDHVFLFIFCSGVIIISVCCASVLCALKRPGPGDRNNVEMTEKDTHTKSDRGRAVENQQKRKAFRIISHILASILVCYLPLVVSYFMRMANFSEQVFACDIFPAILSITRITVLISPLVRMNSEGHLKHKRCLSMLREKMKGK